MRLALFTLTALAAMAQTPDAAFQKFFAADSPASAARAAADIEKSKITFDEAIKRLKAGRTYAAQKTGVIPAKVRVNNIDHFYSINVPANYDPAKKYQVRFQLHGGVGGRTDNQPRGNGEIGQLAGNPEQIYVLPYAWDAAGWWSDDQVLSLATIVDSLKRTYNVDENRVHVSGVSDGGTGAYWIAMRDTTPYASFLPLNGFIMVLGNSEIDDGKVYPGNLRNKPLFVINGGKDRLYPTRNTEPYTRFFMKNGIDIEYHPQPEGEHNTRWWPEMKDPFEKFVTQHPRQPHPARISWEASDLAHARAHWLVIDQFGPAPGERAMEDLNTETEFSREKKPGRVDLVRKGNTVEATTQGVTAFTLLISPDEFDFTQPIRVLANGREIYNARVQPDLKTLLKWAAKDNDRTMLYAAEVKVSLK
jgi:predicted esterase